MPRSTRVASLSQREAAESWLRTLDEEGTTETINRALLDGEPDSAFTDAAASALAAADRTH